MLQQFIYSLGFNKDRQTDVIQSWTTRVTVKLSIKKTWSC